ncbi:ubiquitin carboxyl-terminal hydrolase CYLD isoform X4 [Hypanus sabinus]|uniref:ubiquitin carboxyl-terminal hydrolase CYLD isoform X4 n=1 Tax=Hypanus sabinus TaxID=79690 RepID=UPI0028C40AFB|nr:ubiquitin carboxyl-terminal hydrolase CYLD isoform X4 [Hypanus sabinus]
MRVTRRAPRRDGVLISSFGFPTKMGGIDDDRRYFIVIKDFTSSRRRIQKGSLGYLIHRRTGETSVTVENCKQVVNLQEANLKEITKDEAELLVDIQDVSRRYELVQNESLFRSISKVHINDVVQLRRSTKSVGIVKNIEDSRKKNGLGLHGTLFQVSLMEDQNRPCKKPEPCVKVNAGDLIHVSIAEVEPPGLRKNSSTHTSDALTPTTPHPSENLALEVGSMVEVRLPNNAVVFGVIRWIGTPEGNRHQFAGIELDYELENGSDGTFEKNRYFECEQNKAIFMQLSHCKPDARFLTSELKDVHKMPVFTPAKLIQDDLTIEEDVPPIHEDQVLYLMEGRRKGIQGHYNSCYLDSTIFSLFSFTSVLDSILHRPGGHDEKIQQILREDIVNPLRKTGFVNAKKVMKLRKLLGSDTFMSAEKDPEEFINVLLHEVLAADPLLKIRSGEKIQESNCYQIILEKDDKVEVPTVQFLLERSFLSCDLKFEEIPSCLLVQMPRFGKQFKMYTEIMPSLELDITDLLHNSLRQCFICGVAAEYECVQCLLDPMLSPGAIKQYCNTCNSQVHSHKERKDHQFRKFSSPNNVSVKVPFPRHKMELFAVLCIETSHYVSFVKYGSGKYSWLFFDSMADRIGDENIPEITACPQIGDYLMMSEEKLSYTNMKQLDGFAKRLFCDAYMCMYRSPRMCLYK